MSLLAPDASAQRVSFGVVVGGYANRDFDSRYALTPAFNRLVPAILQSDSGGYVVGPSFDVRLFPQLSLGVEALYKPLHYSVGVTFQNGAVIGFAPATVVTWQFPVLAKYKFSLGGVRPFLEGGPSFRTTGNLNAANPSHFGVSAGVGAETEWRRLRIAPRVRYTRWAEDPLRTSARTRADQLEFLAGFSYAPASDAHPLGRRISFGLVIGANMRDESTTITGAGTNPFTGAPIPFQESRGPRRLELGALVELALSPRFSIEGNAIARSFFTTRKVTREPGRTVTSLGSFALPWEFPLLVKYRLATRDWRPFLALGPSFRLQGRGHLWNYGATAGTGVEVNLKRIKVSPALRYTHWAADRSQVTGRPVPSSESRNRVDVLVGVSF